jgi:hypothetical protein
MDHARFTPRLVVPFVVAGVLLFVVAMIVRGGADPLAKPNTQGAGKPERTPPPRLKLTDEQQQRLDRVVDQGLKFLASQQQEDGSFPTQRGAEPAVTSLCVMAFLARGHVPGKPPYGRRIDHAIDYILKQQDPKSGAIYQRGPGWPRRGNYNHAISALMLCDAFREMNGAYRDDEANARRRERVEEAIRQALAYARKDQTRSKSQVAARGAWRYLRRLTRNDADLSVTAWMIMFYSAAKKIGFQVPKKGMDDALRYVRRSFDKKQRGFVYALAGDERYCSRAMVGAGVLCLLLGDDAANPTIPEAADWIHRNSFEPYNGSRHPEDRYHYSAFYCSQAMALLGGKDFQEFYPKLLLNFSHHQHEDGSWEPEAVADGAYGNVYTTALALLALCPPYEKLASHVRDRVIPRAIVPGPRPANRRLAD